MASRRFPTAAVAAEAFCAMGGAFAVAIAFVPRCWPVVLAIRDRAGAGEHMGTYIGFVLAVVAAVVGVLAGLGLARALARFARWWLAPSAILALVMLAGLSHARWLVWGGPLFVVAATPLLVTGRVRGVARRVDERATALVCIASESACLCVGFWLPYAEWGPALLLPGMFAAAGIAATLAVLHAGDDELRWKLVAAGLPAVSLPLFGLVRNPSAIPALVVTLLFGAALVAFRRWPPVQSRVLGWARRNASLLAMPALVLVLVVPWHFRDMGVADHAGHEGQHLGWINSMVFGKLMMADAGLTYGPAREYILALVAWSMGGLTLEHVRLAHVVVNVVGLGCLFAAMRKVCAGQIHWLLLGLALLLTHSALASYVVYTKTYSFGWADAARAGLATLSLVLALTRRLDGGGRRRVVAAGALAGLSVLYSHDFGVVAVIATLVGIASEVFVARAGQPARARAVAALRAAGAYVGGVALVLGPFLAFYAAKGKLSALLRGYAWTVQVSSGNVAFPGRVWEYGAALDSPEAMLRITDDAAVTSRAIDYVIGPSIAVVGLAHAAAALVRRRFVQRTTVILGLAVLGAGVMHHALLCADAWHMANGTTPGLVLMVALAAGGRRLVVRWPKGRALAVAVPALALLPVLWLADGGLIPINMRLSRIASGEERPSKGKPYVYPDLPRAGDLGMGDEHLKVVRYVRAHSAPEDPVFCTTWMLGGGTEAFLSERRNPTSFDVPDEVSNDAQQRQALSELRATPPVLIVGDFFDYLGADARAYLRGWHHVPADPGKIWSRNTDPDPPKLPQ